MDPSPLTYIVIVNWNGLQDTLECLSSLTKIESKNVVVVVVDNGSADDSVNAIRHAYPKTVLVETGKNLRFSGGSNVGIRLALERGAEQIMLLNNDTVVDPQLLALLTSRLQSSPDIGVVAPKILYSADPTRIWYAGGEISMWTGTMRHVGIRKEDSGLFDKPGETEYASGCCFLVRRETVQHVGLLDEAYFMYTEDADWCLRARRAGYQIFFEPRARVWHKVSVSAGGHLSGFKLRHKFLSNMRFFGRYAKWYHWLVFPWLNILVNGIAAVRYLMRDR